MVCVTDLTEVVVVLNSDAAIQAFSKGGNVTVGGESQFQSYIRSTADSHFVTVAGNISASAGPVGTGAQLNAALQSPSPMFSYTRSKGMKIAKYIYVSHLCLMYPTSRFRRSLRRCVY